MKNGSEMRKWGLLCVLALMAHGEAEAKQPPLNKHTQSGKAEAVIPGVTVEEFRNEMVLSCSKNGMDVLPETNSVTCSQLQGGGRGLAAELLLGNRLSGKPYNKIKFTFAQDGEDVFVTAESYLEMTMGFGEIKRIPYTNNAVQNQIQAGLDLAAENARSRNGTSTPTSATPAHENGAPKNVFGTPGDPSGGMKWKPKGF